MSPVRARSPSSSRSPARRKMSRSPVRASRKWSRQSISPVQASSPARSKSPIWRRSPQRRKYSVRSRSPIQSRAATRTRSPVRTKAPIRTRSPVRSKSPVRGRSPKRRSPLSRSPSPHNKRLKRAQETMEFDRARDREYDRSSIKDYERGRHKDKDKDSSRDVTQKGRRHSRSISPKDNRQRRRHESESPYRKSAHHIPERPKSSNAGARDEVPNQSPREMSGNEDIDMSSDALAKMKATEEALKAKQNEKSKSSFELSGKLAAETNKVRGITLLFNEPPDARRPSLRWRLYVFKGGEALNEPLYIHRQTCYLFGRERRVADIPTDHPSCSKQHAVIQFRQVEKEEPDGAVSKQVRPYLMDLGSTNGTFLNDSRLEPQRYYELFEKDTIKFGNSSREYVILHENSAG